MRGHTSLSRSASLVANSRAFSCMDALSGTSLTCLGWASYSTVTITLDVRNTTVTVRCPVPEEEVVS